jgi:putative protein-disulfide isomerase
MQDNALLYFMDPLCGWCYGFSEVINKFKQNHPELRPEIITGGMVVGEREGLVEAQFADYILNALPRLEEYTGAEIGEPFKTGLRERSLFMSSLKPSLACHAIKQLKPDATFEFMSAMQKHHYVLGEDLQNDSSYVALCEEFNIDADLFLKEMNSEDNRYRMQQDFAFSASCKIQGFPAVVLKFGEQYFLAARGYTPIEQLEQTFESILADTR